MKIHSSTGGRRFAGVLEIAAAAFILLGPTLIGAVAGGWGLYAAFALAVLCLALRLTGGGIYVTVNTGLGVLTLAYALLTFFWADNVFAHIRVIYAILTAVAAMLLAADYFSLEKEKGLGGRLLYMIIISADVCALWNFVYWAAALHFGFAQPLCAGLGDGDLLGMFMAAGLWAFAKAFAKAKKKSAAAFAAALPMVFALVMSRSAMSWLFAAGFAAVCLFKKGRRLPAAVFAAVALASAAQLILGGFSGLIHLADALVSAVKYPAGLGGGGFVSRQTELQSSAYAPVNGLGLGAELASSFGIFGLLVTAVFIGRQLWLACKRKSLFCAFAALLGVFAVFAPVGESPAALILFVGVSVYGEWRLGLSTRVKIPDAAAVALCCVLAAAGIYGAVLAVGDGLNDSGLGKMLTDEETAFRRCSAAAAINPFDSESCYNAAFALRRMYEESGEKEDAVNAEFYIKRAIERNDHSALYHLEYTRLMLAAGNYARAVEENELAVKLAPLNDEYKVSLSENLYRLIQTYERGSIETQRCYKRITDCAEAAADMDSKKLINDWADKAQPYTRIEYFADAGNSADAEASEGGGAE